MSYQNSNRPVCARCRQPLAEGSGYCVGCGMHNATDAQIVQKMTFEKDMKTSLETRMFWDRVMLAIWAWFR